MKRLLIAACSAAVVMAGWACGVSDVIVLVNGVPESLVITFTDENTIVVERLTLQVGDTATLGATAFNVLGQPLGSIPATWWATDPSVASVDTDGVLVALTEGTTDVIANYGEINAVLEVVVTASTVIPPPPSPPPPPPPPGDPPSTVFFHSDWSTALGDGPAALMDADQDNPWTRFGGNPFTVVPNAHGFPTANVLEQVNSDFGWVGFDPRDGVITETIQPGQTRAWRYYIRYVNGQSLVTDNNTHALFDGFSIDPPPGWSTATTWFRTQNTSTEIWHNGPNGFRLGMRVKAGLPNPLRYYSPTLSRDQTYRIEWQIQMVTNTTYNIDAYVFNAAGDTIARPADWAAEGASTTLANEPPITVNNSAEAFSGYWFGLNGYEGADGALYLILGGVAICNTWCGPYPIAGVEN